MYACMTPVGFDTSDKFENHCYSELHDRKFDFGQGLLFINYH